MSPEENLYDGSAYGGAEYGDDVERCAARYYNFHFHSSDLGLFILYSNSEEELRWPFTASYRGHGYLHTSH